MNKVRYAVIYVIVPLLVAVGGWLIMMWPAKTTELFCRKDHRIGGWEMCRLRCPVRHFSLPGMTECKPWLTCSDLESNDIITFQLLGQGAVKSVSL